MLALSLTVTPVAAQPTNVGTQGPDPICSTTSGSGSLIWELEDGDVFDYGESQAALHIPQGTRTIETIQHAAAAIQQAHEPCEPTPL